MKVLGVYEWSGCNPLPPELWLLPKFTPFHPGLSQESCFWGLISLFNHLLVGFSLRPLPNNMPGKISCYCRLVYMPMSYLYGKRFVGPITGLIRSLREEMYNESYDQINWIGARNNVAKVHVVFIFT